jgi:putative transposase
MIRCAAHGSTSPVDFEAGRQSSVPAPIVQANRNDLGKAQFLQKSHAWPAIGIFLPATGILFYFELQADPDEDGLKKPASFTEEQIIALLKAHEAGAKPADLARKHGISEATLQNRKARFGGMDISEAKRLKSLESLPSDLIRGTGTQR